MHAKRLRLALGLTAAFIAAAARPALANYAESAVLLPDGDTLVIGGAQGTPLSSVSGSVTRISRLDGSSSAMATLPIAVASHTVTLLPDGEVLVAGGYDGATVRAELQVYNPGANCWRPTTTMSVARQNHTATALLDGRVLICGGTNASGTYSRTCDIYTPPTTPPSADCSAGPGGSLSSVNMLDPNGRALHTATRLSDGRVFITGGYNSSSGYLVTSELFSPAGNSFGAAHSLIESRIFHRASLMGNGKVLIAGGFNGKDIQESLGFLSSVEIYDPVSDTMVPAQPMNERKGLQAQVVENNGDVTTYGGLGNVTTAYQTIQGVPINAASHLNGALGVFPVMNLNSGASLLQINLQNVPIGANVSGKIIAGAIMLSTGGPTGRIPNLTSDKDDVILPPGGESSPGVFTGAYIDLKDVVISQRGSISGTFPVTFSNGTVTFRPHPNVSVNGVSAAGSNVTFTPTPTSATQGAATITGGSLIEALTISGLPASYIGGTVLSGQLSIVTVSISSSGMANFAITGGNADLTGMTVGTDANGQGSLTSTAFTFTGLSGTVSPTCSTTNCLSQATFNAGNGLVAQTVNGTALATMVVSPVTFTGSENFNATISTVVIRRMDFGDVESFNPNQNAWNFGSLGLATEGALGVLRPNGSANILGGRSCGSTCADIAGGSEYIPFLEAPAAGNGNMSQPRGNHTTTLLPNGKLLVAGGSNGSNVLPTAELFDPNTQTFTMTGRMYEPRDLHTATLLPNGNVLVVGGFTTNALSTGSTSGAEIYYPKAGAWRPTAPLIKAGGALNPATSHTATLLADGSVLVAGGYQSGPGGITYLKSAALYYSTSATWVPLPDMPVNRALHTATLLQDGRVLLAGGINESGLLTGGNFGLIFDPRGPSSGAGSYWYTTAAQGTGMQSHGAAALQDGRVLVAGGNDGFGEARTSLIYTPGGQANGSGAWTATGIKLNVARFNETLTALPNGSVAAIGGATALGNSVTNIETFEVSASSWQMMTNNLGTKRANQTTTVGLDGKLYIIGGFDGTRMLSTYESVYFTGSTDAQTPNAGNPSIRKSSITAIDVTPFDHGQTITFTGQRLQGAGESAAGAAGGNASNDAPRLLFQALDPSGGGGGQGGGGFALDLTSRLYRSPDPNLFSKLSTSMTVTLPGNVPVAGSLLPYGWYAARTNSNSIFADGLAVQAAPPNRAGPPGAVSAATLGISSITWSWTPSTGTFDGYAVYSASSGIFIGTTSAAGPWSCQNPPNPPITTPCLIQTQLTPNTTGSIVVAAYNLSGDGPLTFGNTFYTLANPPVSVAISSVGFSNLQLTWDPNGNAPGTVYEVSQSSDNFVTDFSTPVPILVNLISTNVTISPLSLNTTYYYRVRAYNGVGIPSAFSLSVSTRTRAPISNLVGTPVANDPTTIEWTWSDPGGTVGFNVYNSTTGAKIGVSSAPFFFDTGLSTNTRRSVMVSALTSSNNTLLEGPLSPGASCFTLAAPPVAASPGIPSASISTNSFTGAWGPNGNPIGTLYTMLIYDDALALISSATVTPFFNAGYSGFAHTSQPFTAKVFATNGDGVTTSLVVLGSTSTLPMAPLGLFVTNTTPSTISVSWSNQRNGSTTTYEVSFSTDNFNDVQTWVPFSAGVNTTSATITGLLTSTTYSIRVQAANQFGIKSAFSNSITTSPFNGGVALGSLGLQVNHLQNNQLIGSIGNGRQISLLVPSNSFTTDTFLTISTFDATVSPCPGGLNIAFRIDPNPLIEPLTPLLMTLAYSPAEFGSASPALATLMRITDSGECVPVKTSVNTGANQLSVALNHISRFQVAAVTPATSPDSTFIYPNPLYLSRGQGYFTFSQMPAQSRVRVFTMRGELLADLTANASGIATWDATNRVHRTVASGVYLVAVEAPDKTKKILKVVVLR